MKIKKIISRVIFFVSALISSVSRADDGQIKDLKIFVGSCQVAIIGTEDHSADCKNVLVIIFNQSSQSVFGFELFNNKKYSFVSTIEAEDQSKIKISELSVDTEVIEASGECVVTPSVSAPREVTCGASKDGFSWSFEMTSLQKL